MWKSFSHLSPRSKVEEEIIQSSGKTEEVIATSLGAGSLRWHLTLQWLVLGLSIALAGEMLRILPVS